MAKKKQIPELKVLFDTNALFTQAASELVKPEICALINEHSGYTDHKITWHMPDVVRHERQYQMERAALALLPSMAKIERVLGHNLGFNEVILKQRIADAVNTQLGNLNIRIAGIDPQKVDLSTLMLNAVYRRPPFDPGEKEKGFRDALVVESLRQLVSCSPVTPTVCRIVLVTEDKLLTEAANSATAEATNVRIVSDIEELRGLISTLVSAVGEQFIAEIQPKAHAYFFTKDENSTLYYKENIRQQIREKYSTELAAKPDGVTESETGTWYVGKSRFVKKEGQRIYWATRIEPTFKGYRVETKQQASVLEALASSSTNVPKSPDTWANLANLFNSPEKTLVMNYGAVFEVDWSVTLGQHKKLTSGKIEQIRYVETRARDSE